MAIERQILEVSNPSELVDAGRIARLEHRRQSANGTEDMGGIVVKSTRSRDVSIPSVSRSQEGHPKFGSLYARFINFSIRELRRAGLAFEGDLPGLAELADGNNPETAFRPEFVRTRGGARYTVLMPITPEASALLPRR